MNPRAVLSVCATFLALLTLIACSRSASKCIGDCAEVEKICLDDAECAKSCGPNKSTGIEGEACVDGCGGACTTACDQGSAKSCFKLGSGLGRSGARWGRNAGSYDHVAAGRVWTLKGCKLQGETEQTCPEIKNYDDKWK